MKALDQLGERTGKAIIVAVDEAQEFRKLNWLRIDRILAYAYDNLRNLRFLLSGSQVGLLYDFLGVNDPTSPLYGRAFVEVKTRRLSRVEAVDFLEKGFAQLGLIPESEVIQRVVEEVDGIIEWLTYFGHLYAVKGAADLDSISSSAAELALQEIRNFLLQRRSPRYVTLLKSLIPGETWSNLKRALEDREGRSINDRTFNELMGTLVKAGLVEKQGGKYLIADPVLRRAASSLP